MFLDGEIWTIDTYPFKALPRLITLDEPAFAKSVQYCATFLHDRFDVDGPFRWVAGLEGVSGRLLPINSGLTRGPCATDIIEHEGSFCLGDDPTDALEPFFEEVYEQCGLMRPPRKSVTTANL
jgi:hypothetical protein